MNDFCNICGTIGHFKDYNGRKKVRCKSCGSLERHRKHFNMLKKKRYFFNEDTILLISPAKCMETSLTKMSFKCDTMDIVEGRAKITADITQMPFTDKEYEFIYCSHVLEHVKDDRKAIREMYRVLKPGCYLFLCVPVSNIDKTVEIEYNNNRERQRWYGHPDHVRKYGKDVIKRITEAGFKVNQLDYDTFAGLKC